MQRQRLAGPGFQLMPDPLREPPKGRPKVLMRLNFRRRTAIGCLPFPSATGNG